MQSPGSFRQLGAELWADSHTKLSFAVPLLKLHNLELNFTSTNCFREFELREAAKRGITLLYRHKFWDKNHPKIHL